MRVCFLSRRYFPAISGMSVYADNLIRHLCAMGHDVTMVSQYRDDAVGKKVYGGGPPPQVPGVRVIGLQSLGEEQVTQGLPADFEADIASMVDTVVAEHARAPFDVIHAQYAYPTGLAAMEASRRLDVPHVISIQGGDGHWVGLCCETHKAAMAAVLNGSMALLIGCRSFAEEVHENHGTDLSRFTIVPGAVDTTRFAPNPNRALGALSDRPKLLYHGRVDRRKGALEFLHAAAVLAAERPLDVRVSGIGPDLNAAEELAAHLRLPVKFLGYTDYASAPQVYLQGDIFVSPTHAEGFSNTILEAMACGLPILSCLAVGVMDCLRDGENGLMVPISDQDALVQGLRRLLDDADLRHRLASCALDEVRTRYDWPVVAAQIAGIYHDLQGQPVPADWVRTYDAQQRYLSGADISCRFRADPHLL
ncbi:MAG: glycosyltransferase family 4 protein [Candidatus Competibacteraceae bacterium]|nr:glycosyltransferase family 4 protein [Candidatus Competibacteraceae bacterium]